MGYYMRHTIYLQDSNEEKLIYITELLHQQEVEFIITEETVFDDNGEPISVRCVSDANWNCGSGYKWPDLDYNMQQVSEHFNQKYPDEEIRMYIRTEDNYEATLAFLNGSQIRESKIYHYRNELDSICLELEEKQSVEYFELYKVHIIHQRPIVLHHDGAYVMIGFNVFELFKNRFKRQYTTIPPEPHHGHWNYNNLEFKIQAQQVLFNLLSNLRANGGLTEYS